MAQISEVYQLVFQRDMYDLPILNDLAKKFRLTVTIRRAMLSEEGGWAEVRLTGPEEEVGRAIAALQTTAVNTTGPIADLVEPDYDAPGPAPATIGRGT